ncbi:MAG: DUF2203 domain-containing protein [Deltaproteobacteria bacterium]|nr:DUF2203 domain-containing protein [Deltaproteobacteria bacterium]
MVNRFFTPAEANHLLAEVRPLFERATERHRLMRRLVTDATEAELARRVMPELERLKDEVQALLEQIVSRGVEVKGLDDGLLDFPALRNGRPVYLCWKVGDDKIEWWHPLHTGFLGRQRVEGREVTSWEWRN